MTLEQFTDELRQLQQQFVWGLVPDTSRGSERRTWPRYRIRAQLEDSSEGLMLFDPIGAVCYSVTGKVYGEEAWEAAAAEIGLPRADAQSLMAAANDRTWIGPEGMRRPVRELQALRVLLIEAVEEIAETVYQ